MAAWFADKILPGLIVAGIIGVSHFRLKRHITTLTARQTRQFEQKTDQQTETLTTPRVLRRPQ